MKNPRTINQVQKEIKKLFPLIELIKGEGYFWIWSEDEETAKKIGQLFSTSIYVDKICHLSMEQWIQSVKSVLADTEGQKRNPVYDNL